MWYTFGAMLGGFHHSMRLSVPPHFFSYTISDVSFTMQYKGPLALDRPVNSGWFVILDDIPGRSFISYKPAALNPTVRALLFENCLNHLPWQRPIIMGSPLNREACWLTSGSCTCPYTYGRTSWPAIAMPPWMSKATHTVAALCGVQPVPNSCNLNLYRNGGDAVGWHSDNEALFDAVRTPTTIISLTLGSCRYFDFAPANDQNKVVRLELGDGDLLTMEGLFQKNYIHRVPAQPNEQGLRINITWRSVIRHDKSCSLSE